MSLKAELIRWSQALDAYDAADYSSALDHFAFIADSSKVLFNIGLIHATLGSHSRAVMYYDQAHSLDQYLAVSFFQSGVSLFLMERFENAYASFDNALAHMRDNPIIDYDQLGLAFKLYSAEICFNIALSMMRIGQQSQGMSFLDRARREKQIPEHSLIDEAYASSGANFTVFSLPVGVLFRPSPIKLKNLKAKNYLGTAKLVAATESNDAFIGFSGAGAVKRERSFSMEDDASSGRSPARVANADVPALNVIRKRVPSPTPDLGKQGHTNDRSQHTSPSDQAPSGLHLSGTSPTQPLPATPSRPLQLPKLDTTSVSRTGIPDALYAGARYIAATRLPGQQDTHGENRPLTPPESPPREPASHFSSSNAYARGESTDLDYAREGRDTGFMEDLLDGYNEAYGGDKLQPSSKLAPLHAPSAPQGQSPSRVADWASRQAKGVPPVVTLSRAATRHQGSKANVHLDVYEYGPGGISPISPAQQLNVGTLRRNGSGLMRQDTLVSRAPSGSDYNDGSSVRTVDMVSFRLKLHFEEEIRGMSIDSDTTWEVFYTKLQMKFGLSEMRLKYRDEDGVFVTIVDESDWDSAVDAAREHCPKGRQDGKLEIWVNEI